MRKTDAKSAPARNVDEYLAGVPKEARTTLEKLRKTIKAAAPMASEVISYQMPMYKHHGMVVGFGHLVADYFRSEEHTSELQSHLNLVCRLLLEKKKTQRLLSK